MSKVPMTIDVDRFVCTELEDMRAMVKHLDFSGISASIERIQRHATAMEDALYAKGGTLRRAKSLLEGKKKLTKREKKVLVTLKGEDTKSIL